MTFDASLDAEQVRRRIGDAWDHFLCTVASVVRVFLASGAFIFLGVFQRAMLICDEEYVMRRIGDACDEYFGYRDNVLYVCSGNGCQRS